MLEKKLNATTNLESSKGSRKQVSLEHLVLDFVPQLSNRFLVSLDSFVSIYAGILF
jgi:hypothetical protein